MKLLLLLLIPYSLACQNMEANKSGLTKVMSFVNSLDDGQKKKTLLPFNELNRYEWHYFPANMVTRNGIAIKDMDSRQKNHFYSFMQDYLSKEGFVKSKTIMDFENLLQEMEPQSSIRITENYFVAIYGNPEKDSVWGWKISGHHLALNFTIVKDKLAFAPFFFGINPAEVKQGPKKGFRLMKDEEDLAFELLNSMSSDQKQKAIFRSNPFNDILTGNDIEVKPLETVGILARDLTHEQKSVLNRLIAAYLSSVPTDIASSRIKKIEAEDMNDLRFGWAGAQTTGKPHYYRVQGKTFLIEFDNTQASGNHIHSVWRDFNGDYGRDLLKEHYQNSKHHQ